MEKQLLNKLPYDLEAERAVLGSVLLDGKNIEKISDILVPDDFYLPSNSIIYDTMLFMEERGLQIDILTLASKLRERKKLENAGGSDYLAELIEGTPTSTHIIMYANEVKTKSALRKTLEIANRTQLSISNGDVKWEELIEDIQSSIYKLSDNTNTRKITPIGSHIDESLERINKIRNGEIKAGIETGFNKLDELTYGLHKSDLIIVGARPSVGKTTFAVSMLDKISKSIPVILFSLEMSEEQIIDRVISINSNVPLWKIRSGKVNENDLINIEKTIKDLKSRQFYIVDIPAMTVPDIKRAIRRTISECKELGVVVVDYLQLCRPTRYNASTNDQIGEISKGLKGLAKEFNIPIIALSQLNRDIDKSDREPKLSDLRDSGNIEQDADIVMFIHRPNVSLEPERKIIIAKHRNGANGDFMLKFDDELVKFVNYE